MKLKLKEVNRFFSPICRWRRQITHFQELVSIFLKTFVVFFSNDVIQLIWPKLFYLGNPEFLRDGVGDIFACTVMQIPNLENVF